MIYDTHVDHLSAAQVEVVNPYTQHPFGFVFYVDTDTGLMKAYAEDPLRPGHIKMTPWVQNPGSIGQRRDFETQEIRDQDFDVLDRKTRKVLYSFRAPTAAGITVHNLRGRLP